MLKGGESGEDEREEDVGSIDGDKRELQRRNGVQFSSREPQECPPTYARSRNQLTHRHGEVGSRRGKGEPGEADEAFSIPVEPTLVSPQTVHTGIYEGFVMVHSTAEASIPAQSEPAIPQTLTWSPVSFGYGFNVHGKHMRYV